MVTGSRRRNAGPPALVLEPGALTSIGASGELPSRTGHAEIRVPQEEAWFLLAAGGFVQHENSRRAHEALDRWRWFAILHVDAPAQRDGGTRAAEASDLEPDRAGVATTPVFAALQR